MNRPSTIKNLPLNAMRAFEAAARRESFKGAADELSVTPAAISHQVSSLEEYLGVNLFVRSNRQLRLTANGKDFAIKITATLNQLLEFVTEIKSERNDTSRLIVSSPPSLASKWLVPRIHIFRARHPEIELYIRSENQTSIPLKNESVDIAIRYSKNALPEQAEVHAEKLWNNPKWVPVCSPLLINKIGYSSENFLSLLTFPLLRRPLPPYEEGLPNNEAWTEWLRLFLDQSSQNKDKFPPEFDVNTFRRNIKKSPFYSHDHLAIDAAIEGHGVSLTLEPMVIDDIKKGKLVSLLQTKIKDPFAYFILSRKKDAASTKVQTFINWLHEEASQTENVITHNQ